MVSLQVIMPWKYMNMYDDILRYTVIEEQQEITCYFGKPFTDKTVFGCKTNVAHYGNGHVVVTTNLVEGRLYCNNHRHHMVNGREVITRYLRYDILGLRGLWWG